MKTKFLKISTMLVALIFVFTGASLADSGKNRHRNYMPESASRSNITEAVPIVSRFIINTK